MKQKSLSREIREMQAFLQFLEKTERVKAMDSAPNTDKCTHLLRNFSAVATDDHLETLQHFKDMNNANKQLRAHALRCQRCQVALDSMLTFLGYRHRELFPEKIAKILEMEYKYKERKGIYIAKLPAPTTGTFGAQNGRLVYITSQTLDDALFEFNGRVAVPLGLEGLSHPHKREKIIKDSFGRIKLRYHQADIYHEDRDAQQRTYLSIRSI